MTKGEVFIGTLSFYRNIENEAIADRNEGKKDIVTIFSEAETIKNAEDWENKLGFLKGSNINYASGTVKIERGTEFIGNDSIPDAYIYCASKFYSEYLRRKFNADCCIEIFDVQTFLNIISTKLSELGLIYPTLSSGRDIEYIGHSIKDGNKISGNWIKDPIKYGDEAELRLTFVPIYRKDGVIIQPTVNQDKSATFPRDFDEFVLKPQLIECKEIIKYCRWR